MSQQLQTLPNIDSRNVLELIPLSRVKLNKCSKCGCRRIDHIDGVCKCGCNARRAGNKKKGMDLTQLDNIEEGSA